eukprot:TRINITY_DN15038_c0_g1_i1.p1 TRINITY_DN15038_c0_g1~~TRINITY_DN15038_c0_g1_i1.p1  ORF type:complete len:288 (-),score=32.97 TRINITY_DN15038_c0_g1_i1:144-1007(-)
MAYYQDPNIPYQNFSAPDPNQIRNDRFNQLASQYEINPVFINQLKEIGGIKKVIIVDNSGSMSSILKQPVKYDQFNNRYTRWMELRDFMYDAIDIISVTDQQGCDVYPLNNCKPIMNVRFKENIEFLFSTPPGGYTPLTRVYKQVLSDNAQEISERGLLIIIATDGEPTDDSNRTNIREFKQALTTVKSKYENTRAAGYSGKVYTNIIACTDDDQSMEYLNDWDNIIPRLDVTDDYVSERKEILRARGHNFKFSRGDYIVKCIVGSTSAYFDNLDEPSLSCPACVIS